MRRPLALGALLAACAASVATSPAEFPAFSGTGYDQGPNVLLTPEQPVWWLEVRAETTLPPEAIGSFPNRLGITLEPESVLELHFEPVSCEDGSPIAPGDYADEEDDYVDFDVTVHDAFVGCVPREPCVAVACFQAENRTAEPIALRWRGGAFIESEEREEEDPGLDVEITVSTDAWPVSP